LNTRENIITALNGGVPEITRMQKANIKSGFDRSIDRRMFLKAAGAAAVVSALPGGLFAAGPVGRKPNFVFFLIDDLGWIDLGCYGSKFYETPNIDRLASEGMLFTDAYAASPVCSPTRVSIMSGKYPSRLHMSSIGPNKGKPLPGNKLITPTCQGSLPLEEKTIAESLKEDGYSTFFAGKWHLHSRATPGSDFFPDKQGFDVNMGGNSTGQPRGGFFSPYENPQLEDGPDGEYLTDRLTDEAIKFIKSNKDRPFFTYMSYYSVHTPIQAKEKAIARYKAKAEKMGIVNPKRREEIKAIPEYKGWSDISQNDPVYAAMVEHMDENVGRILKTLADNGLDDNTIIIFTSDNGGLSTGSPNGATSTLPLRAGKAWVYEGGVRVPSIIKWPGVTKPGSKCDVPIISTDYYPTMLEMAGLEQNPKQHVDGVNLSGLLKGGKSLDRDAIYFHFPHYHHINTMGPAGAVRAGDYKLVERFENMKVELFNLKDDIGEQHDLSEEKPELTAKLRKMLHDWRKESGSQMPTKNEAYDPNWVNPKKRTWLPTNMKRSEWEGL